MQICVVNWLILQDVILDKKVGACSLKWGYLALKMGVTSDVLIDKKINV